jgi:radical SAM superfamily enzyme YgiQ (UPF0313 family)
MYNWFMNFVGNIIRPPAEHASLLVQVTVGCSHNRCHFCGLYRDKTFSIKDLSEIEQDCKQAARLYPDTKRMFLCDGDVMAVPQKRLVEILEMIHRYLPDIKRIGVYANAKSLVRKSLDDLKELKKLRLGIVYMGLESGDDEVLSRVCKGVDVATQVEQGRKVREAGMKLSCTVLLGLGGVEGSIRHARLTGEALTAINPNYVGTLMIMLVQGTELWRAANDGDFQFPDALGLIRELREMLLHTELSRGVFSSNHASNYLPLQVRMPGGKSEALAQLDLALDGAIPLRPDYMRGI